MTISVLVLTAGISWGSVPEWVGGIGAAAALWFLGQQWRRDAGVRRETAAQTERAQASLVSAWVGDSLTQADLAAAGIDGTAGLRLVLRNGSKEPVYDALAINPATGQPARQYPVVPPEFDIDLEVAVPEAPSALNPFVPVEVRFRDAAGRRWHRDRHGMLKRSDLSASQWLEAAGGWDAAVSPGYEMVTACPIDDLDPWGFPTPDTVSSRANTPR